MGSDGIASGRRGTLYYRPLTGRQLYSVVTDALLDGWALGAVGATVVHEADKLR